MNDIKPPNSDQEEGAEPTVETVSDTDKVGTAPALASVKAAIAIARANQARAAEQNDARDYAVRTARANAKKAATAARLKERKRRNKQVSRAKQTAANDARRVALPAKAHVPFDRAVMLQELIVYRAWLLQPGQRRAQLRRSRYFYWKARRHLIRFRLHHERNPGGAEFARYLSEKMERSFDRYQGVYLLKQIATLEGIDGPWPAVTENVETLGKTE